ncbi:hypothetical protein H4R35_000134 [Dimargaris xerosporica]|nr:hypothetical protein H4R35_000134 [Dimargaris xerosporica]
MAADKVASAKLFIGNLDPTVDEYAILKLFEPFGKIKKLDYMFHRHGPKRGQPRGYCFLEYVDSEQAQKAVDALNGRTLKQRRLVVSAAVDSPRPRQTDDSYSGPSRNRPGSANTGGSKHHPYRAARPQPSPSVTKAQQLVGASTNAKILALEKKLAELKKPPPPSSSS